MDIMKDELFSEENASVYTKTVLFFKTAHLPFVL